MTGREPLARRYAISAILARSSTLDDALTSVLQTLCRDVWNVATYWQYDPFAGHLRCRHAWPLPPTRGGALAQLSRQLTYPVETGLPGRVWSRGAPLWIPDIARSATFERTVVALKTGMQAAGAVPVASERAQYGVLEVFRRERGTPDADLTQNLAAIGADVGQFLERLHQDEQRRAVSEQLLRAVEQLPLMVFALDRAGVITLHAGRRLETLGFHPPLHMGRSIADLEPDVAEESTIPPQVQRALAGETVTATTRVTDGVIETRYTPLYAADGERAGVLGLSIDATDWARREEALQHQALHDPLTTMPNRALLLDRLQHAMRIAHRQHQPLALLLLDLNGFNAINATFGHHDGDVLLQHVADRIQSVLRASDTVARLGADEFAIVLPDASAACAGAAAGRMLQALEQPVPRDEHSLSCSGRIGIAIYPDHADDLQTLLQHAAAAMAEARRRGSGYALYDPTQDPDSPSRFLLIGELRQAIEGHDLVLYYQPLIDLHTGQTTGVEALVRWQHPRHGLLQPGQFVPLAERAGLIRPLSRWVLQEAIRQGAAWYAQGLALQVVVNLSVQDLYDSSLAQAIMRSLDQWSLPSGRLAVEITESTIMTNAERALDAIADLHTLGVHTSIDDFGTGYSSLAYLKHLPVDQIKIDRSFVRDMTAEASDAVIVAAVVDLGHKLGLQVVAEGVETRATLEALSSLGCDYAQGFYISHPLPVDEITIWLGRERHRARAD